MGSWLRIIDPDSPSPARRADDRRPRRPRSPRGPPDRPALVGLRANGLDVEVELERPGADFPAIASAPLFAVVPPAVWRDGQDAFGAGAVVSGGYAVADATAEEITLERNDRYWAGPPAIRTARLLLDIGGRSPVAAFESDELDYTEISIVDAPWIAYDRDLGPQLREIAVARPDRTSASTRRARRSTTCSSARRSARRSTGGGSRRLVRRRAGSGGQHGPARRSAARATKTGSRSMTPAAPATCWPRQAIPGGAGLPRIQFAVGGAAIADADRGRPRARARACTVELVTLDDHLARLNGDDPPNMWISGWIADYPGPERLPRRPARERQLGEQRPMGVARRSTQAIADALATRDPAASEAAFERALAEIQREVPVVPLYVGTDWALSRDGLLGAGRQRHGHPADRRAWRGRHERCERSSAVRGRIVAGARRRARARAASRRRRPDVRRGDRDGHVRRGHRRRAAGDPARGRGPRRGGRSNRAGRAHVPGRGPESRASARRPSATGTRRRSAACSRTRASSSGSGSRSTTVGSSTARRRRSATRTTGSRGGRSRATLVRVHWVRGRRRVRAAGARDRRARGRGCDGAARRRGDRADRLLRLRRSRGVLRRPRARPCRRTSAGIALAEIRTLFAQHRAGRGERSLGRHRHPARADPPRLRHGHPEPVPRAAPLAERGPRRLPGPGLRLRRPGGGRGRRAVRRAHAAARARRALPDDGPAVQPRLRRERVGDRLPHPDARPGRARRA